MDVQLPARGLDDRGSRVDRARDRARRAKFVLGSLVALAFVVGFEGAKSHAHGHAKGRLKPLSAPSSFQQAVRRSAVISPGSIAPPQQPPPVVQTSVS
jgi:hypothetical protein